MLIDHMASGLSFEAFAGVIGVNQDTLHEWVKVWPAFSEAKKDGLAKGRIFWEKIGHAGMSGKIKNFNSTVWVFSMKNRFGWRDKQSVEHTGEGGGPLTMIVKDYTESENE